MRHKSERTHTYYSKLAVFGLIKTDFLLLMRNLEGRQEMSCDAGKLPAPETPGVAKMSSKTPQQIGRASRNKGKRFERQCRAVMVELTGWPDWKRTQRGDTQHRGDLVPCEPDGRELAAIACPRLPEHRSFYVECRSRATLSKPEMARWWDDTKMQARKGQAAAVLLCKQDRGPILAFCSWIQPEEDRLIAAVV